MSIVELARVATLIERIVDTHGWGGFCDGIGALVREYYEGENETIIPVIRALAIVRNKLTERCPDAPGSHDNEENHAG